MPNHLKNAISPYLLQHADNPVDWYPWGDVALDIAHREDKPIFLSIGYAACHWCHVMAHESFENPATAEIMNTNFVNIKVDREERPDIDTTYMAAVIALTGQGGWPMSVFLTPDLEPFYAGTYFPPRPAYGMPSFTDVLNSLISTWKNKREDIIQAGMNLSNHLKENARIHLSATPLNPERLDHAEQALLKSYDWQAGGWGSAPKFPQPMALEFLLRRHGKSTRNTLSPVHHALQFMASGGMYDVLGGGFSRYSTDNNWHIPHFEKMLFDNAQLIPVYLHAWQLTGEESFKKTVMESLQFVIHEMLSPEGGFYSSLDADSDGEEGKYYKWSMAEIRSVLRGRDDLFESAYGLSELPDTESGVVLQRVLDDSSLAIRFKLSKINVQQKIHQSHALLLSTREERVRPSVDDKVLTSWNGLMLAAFAEAARVFEDKTFLEVARKNAKFILTSLRPNDVLRHAWRNGQTTDEVFLEDFAALILGLVELYQTDFDSQWYTSALNLTGEMINQFQDPDGGFYDTPKGANIVITRPKDLQDNAVPSGNALACEALLKMAAFSENREWNEIGVRMLFLVSEQATVYPTAFARWLSAADFASSRIKQIAILGDFADPLTRKFITEISNVYKPRHIIAASQYPPHQSVPKLLTDRLQIDGKPTAYVCEGFICNKPTTNIEEFREQIRE